MRTRGRHRKRQKPSTEIDYYSNSMGIADGYRPSNTRFEAHNNSHRQPPRQILTGRANPPPRPTSITKPSRIDSFTLRHDGALGHLGSSSSGNHIGSTRRNISRSASASSLTSEESSTTASEAASTLTTSPSRTRSHTSSDRLDRRASVLTSSTGPLPSVTSYTGPNGPTHPYMMYPQNTVPTAESSAGDEQEHHEVGFPGHAQSYRRRITPSGEGAMEIIGPDGHIEQLPPYSLYSEDVLVRKQRAHLTTPIVGAGGIGLATRDPAFDSNIDLHSPQSRASTRSLVSASDASLSEPTVVAAESEKPRLRAWKAVARRRLCGIVPIWAIILAGLILVIFVLILGTVLAVLKPKHSSKAQDTYSHGDTPASSASSSSAMTSTPDASIYSTLPASISTLPTGTYALPVSAPTLSQSSCIGASAQNAAWSCQLPGVPLTIVVDQIPGADPLASNAFTIKGDERSPSVFQYGAQIPELRDPQILSLVSDVQEPSRGPAWFFQALYDKVVHLPERAIGQSTTRQAVVAASNQVHGRGQNPGPGEKTWVCYWNETLLEAFVYVNMVSANAHNSSVLASLTSNAEVLSTTYEAAQASSTPWMPAVYPNVIKMIDRRMPQGNQSTPPQCVKFLIMEDWSAQPFVDPTTGLNVIVTIDENQPAEFGPIATKRSVMSPGVSMLDTDLIPRQTSATCGCVWVAS